jgi:hypothetical protein
MKYLCKIYEDSFLAIGEGEETPEGYIEIAPVDYHAASILAVGYFYHKVDKETVKVRTFSEIEKYRADSAYKKATASQQAAYDTEHGSAA